MSITMKIKDADMVVVIAVTVKVMILDEKIDPKIIVQMDKDMVIDRKKL